MLSMPASAGSSKSGAAMKVSSPVDELILKRAASAPPEIEYVRVSAGRSTSVAVTVVTAKVFSAIERLPFDVITGILSSIAVTVTTTSCVAVSVPSETWTVALYILSTPESAGFSKLGAVTKVSSPVEELMLKRVASAPPEIE